MLSELAAKLTHPIDEIRLRAAESLKFKWVNGLVTAEQVASDSALVDALRRLGRPYQELAADILGPVSESGDITVEKRSQISRDISSSRWPESERVPKSTPLTATFTFPANIAMRPPSIPDAGNWHYDKTHLAPKDDKFIQHFHQIMESGLARKIRHDKVQLAFDILCFDFGAQIFLQRPEILDVMVRGCFAQDMFHQSFCLQKLEEVVLHWHKWFRRSSFGSRYHNTATFPNNTPNVSYSGPTSSSDRDGGDVQQSSPPFACHDLFQRLFPLTKLPSLSNLLFRVFDALFPLIQCYLEEVAWIESHEEIDFVKHYMDYAQFYLEMLVDLVGYTHVGPDGVPDEDLTEAASSLLASSILYLFPSWLVDAYPILISSLYSYLCSRRCLRFSHVLAKELTSSQIGDGLLRHLVSDPETQVRVQALEAMAATQDYVVDVETMFHLLTYSIRDKAPNVSESAHTTLMNLICNLKREELRSFMPLIMETYRFDHGQLFERAWSIAKADLSEAECLATYLSGMLFKSESMREWSWNQMRRVMNLNPRGPALDSFVFSAVQTSVLNSLVDNLDRTGELLSIDDSIMVLQRIAEDDNDAELAAKSIYCRLPNLETQSDVSRNDLIPDLVDSFILLTESTKHETTILYLFASLQVMLEDTIVLCQAFRADLTILQALARLSQSQNDKLRFMVARILSLALFSTDVWMCSALRDEELVMRDIASASSTSPTHVSAAYKIPAYVSESIMIYGRFEFVTYEQERRFLLSIDECQLICIAIRKSSRALGPYSGTSYEQLCQKLSQARSHDEFMSRMDQLKQLCFTDNDLSQFPLAVGIDCVSKFLAVPPASQNDTLVFGEALDFLVRSIQRQDLLSDDVAGLLLHPIQSNLIPLIMGDEQERIITLLANLAIRFLSYLTVSCSREYVCKLVEETQIVDAVKAHLIRCFSTPQSASFDLRTRIESLKLLFRLVACPNLVVSCKIAVVMDLISVLTHTLGCLMETFTKESFTYQDRMVFRLVSLCLRNISRVILEHRQITKDYGLWGDHWLFNGELDWLVGLLADDEIFVQQQALGMLSNLICVPEAYRFITQKIPGLVDMALAYALDSDRADVVRKEACLIINNVFVSQHRSKTADRFRFRGMLEQALFFDRLRDMLSLERFVAGHSQGILELLLNLAILDTDYVRTKFNEFDLWMPLVAFLFSESQWLDVIPKREVSLGLSLRKWHESTFETIHRSSLSRCWKLVLDLFHTLSMGHDSTFNLLASKKDFVKGCLAFLASFTLRDSQLYGDDEAILTNTCLIITSLLPRAIHHLSVNAMDELSDALSWSETLIIAMDVAIRTKSKETELAIVQFLLSILGTCQLSETFHSKLMSGLECGIIENTTVADVLAGSLNTMLQRSEDESLTLDLLCLLCQLIDLCPASRRFTSKNPGIPILESLIPSFGDLITTKPNWDGSKILMATYALRCSLVCANSHEDIDMVHQAIFELLFQIHVAKKLTHDFAMILTSHLLRLIDSFYRTDASLCIQPVVNLSSVPKNVSLTSLRPKTILLLLRQVLLNTAQRLANTSDVFVSALNLLMFLFNSEAVRIYAVKLHFFRPLYSLPVLLWRNKDEAKLGSMLQFMAAVSRHQTKNMFDLHSWMTDVASLLRTSKNLPAEISSDILIVLRNLASTRDAKTTVISDENFLASIREILRATVDPRLAYTLASTLWVLAYDNQRVVATLRQSKVGESISTLLSQVTSADTERNGKSLPDIAYNLKQLID